MKKRFVSIGECMVEMAPLESNQFRLAFSGDCLNTAWYARSFLGENWQVDFVTLLGDDIYSCQMLEFFRQNSIGVSHISQLEGRTCGLCIIHQADGDRHFTYWRSNSAARSLANDEVALSNALMQANIIHFSGITLAIIGELGRTNLWNALANAKNLNAKIVFDPNIRPALWSSLDLLKETHAKFYDLVDIILPSFDDEKTTFGDATPMDTAHRYQCLGINHVVVKDGAKNALIVQGNRTIEVATNPKRALDASGAGDAFNGGYLAALENGMSVEKSAALAHTIAGEVVIHRGALMDQKEIKILWRNDL